MFFTQKIIHLVRTQKFPKNYHFLPPVMYTNQFLSGIKKFWLFGRFCVRTKWTTPNSATSQGVLWRHPKKKKI